MCVYNYDMQQGYYTQHSFTLAHLQWKVQKIVLPSFFKSGKTATGSTTRPAGSVLWLNCMIMIETTMV